MDAKAEFQVENDTDITLEIMRYYQEEFMYRHQHFWDLTVKFFVLFIVVSTLPIISGVLGISLNNVSTRSQILFPLFSILIALFSHYVLLQEVRHMNSVNKAKFRINQTLLPQKYQYEFFDKKNLNSDKKKLSAMIPNTMLIIELAIAVCVIVIIYGEQ